jgi:hypothetical protein
MSYLVVLHADNELYELDLSSGGVTVGSGGDDTLRPPSGKPALCRSPMLFSLS